MAICALALIGTPARAADAPDISGTYWATEYHAKIAPLGGGELPFTADGKAAYEANIAGLKDGSLAIDDLRKAAWYLDDEIKRREKDRGL